MHTRSLPPAADVEPAWRFFKLNWAVLACLSAALAVSAALANFSIEPTGLLASLGFVVVYAGFAHANALSAARRDPQVMFALGATAQIVLVTVVMAPLTYVAAAINFPLQDANLLRLDRALSLDWAAYVGFVNDRPVLAACLSYGYTMIRWPLFAIPVVLAGARRFLRIEEFTLAFALALLATTIISALLPAIGVYHQIGLDPAELKNLDPRAYVDQLRDFEPVRSGALRHLDLLNLAGIVTFPSFHAASALLYAWALWPVRWMRPLALLANGAMLASTPIDGGHYFVDLIAGLAIAVLAILVARKVGNRLAVQEAAGAAASAQSSGRNSPSGALSRAIKRRRSAAHGALRRFPR